MEFLKSFICTFTNSKSMLSTARRPLQTVPQHSVRGAIGETKIRKAGSKIPQSSKISNIKKDKENQQQIEPIEPMNGESILKQPPIRILKTSAHSISTSSSESGPERNKSIISPQGVKCPNSFFKKATIYTVNGKPYFCLEKIGKGGSSKVYKVMTPQGDVYALKRVDLSHANASAIESFKNEINLLKMFENNDKIIQLIDSEISEETQSISIILELGDIDLRSLIEKNRTGNAEVDSNFLRLMWQQMLEAVQIVHDANVIHGDLKPANFMFVKGTLKLIDFGIAKTIAIEDTTNIERPNQAGTLNYMSPEALMMNQHSHKIKVGRSADVWSLGCILYQLVYNQPPFPQIDWYQKIQAIVDETYNIDFPILAHRPDFTSVLDVMQMCLQRDPKSRPKIMDLLNHPYLTLRPDFLITELLDLIEAVQEQYSNVDFDSNAAMQLFLQFEKQLVNGDPLTFPDIH